MGSTIAKGSKTLTFPDKNLQLALLDETQSSPLWLAALEADYEDSRGSHPTWPTWSAIRQGDKTHNLVLEQYLLTLGVEEEPLAKVASIDLSADRDLYGWIYSFWWESGDHFVIRDLSGIESCHGVEVLRLDRAIVDECSLTPVGKLESLRELAIDARATYRDIEALAALPNLKTLELLHSAESKQGDEWNRVVDALCEKGLPSLRRL